MRGGIRGDDWRLIGDEFSVVSLENLTTDFTDLLIFEEASCVIFLHLCNL